MFSYTLLKEHFQAALLADWVSGRNKHDGSPESTLDKWSEAATNRGRSCQSAKAEMKERQLPQTSLSPYQAGWVLCQTWTIISGSCFVKSSKSFLPSSIILLFLYPLSLMHLWRDNPNKIYSVSPWGDAVREYATAWLEQQYCYLLLPLFCFCLFPTLILWYLVEHFWFFFGQ